MIYQYINISTFSLQQTNSVSKSLTRNSCFGVLNSWLCEILKIIIIIIGERRLNERDP